MSIGLPVTTDCRLFSTLCERMYGKTSPIPVRKKMSKSLLREPVADRRGDVQLRVEHPLEHLAEVGLVLLRLDGQDPVPYPPLLEQLDRQVVEVDLEDRDPSAGQPVLDPLLGRRDGERVLGRVRVDEERDLVARGPPSAGSACR